MTIVLAIHQWHHYLLGQKFIVQTNQRSLKHLINQRDIPPAFQKWVTKLLGYDLAIQYNPGLTNKAANTISRLLEPIDLNILLALSLIDVDVI